MAYSFQIFDSIHDINLTDWERARCACGTIVMDPAFMAAAEASMRQTHRFWYIIFYEGNDVPVACTTLFASTIDLADFCDPRLAWAIRRMPGVLSRLRSLKSLICGSPVVLGQHALELTTPHTSPLILPILDGIVRDLAAKTRADIVGYKEFVQSDLEWTSPLLSLGYRLILGSPTYFFQPLFRDLQHYCAALKSHYRQQINHSIRKLKQTGVKISVLTNAKQIMDVYTPEVHSLYAQVFERAELRFEALSIDFFRQLASRLGDRVNLILVVKDSRIIAFGWGLHDGSTYHMFRLGLDYRLNAELDLYFNLVYATLDFALRKGVSKIEIGPTANLFKARLGCHPQPLYVYLKARGRWMSFLFRYAGELFAAKKPAIAAFDIFKSDIGQSQSGESAQPSFCSTQPSNNRE
jgi:hypothetical protein